MFPQCQEQLVKDEVTYYFRVILIALFLKYATGVIL